MEKIRFFFRLFASVLIIFIISCGNKKESQTNILNAADDSKQFAQSLYGEGAKVIASGDLLSNGKFSAIAAIVMNQSENSFWIQKGSFIQKENDGWKVILKMEEKLASASGDLTNQIEAKNGYVISFDSTKKPILINIVIANESGEAASDDAVLKWNDKKNDFEFLAPYDDIPQ